MNVMTYHLMERNRRSLIKVLAPLFALALISTSQAQAPGPIGGHVTVKARNGRAAGDLGQGGDVKVLQVLNLTPTQHQQIQALKETTFAGFAQFREQHAGDRRALAEETRTRMQTYLTGLNGILTPDQAQKYQVWVKGRRYLAGVNDQRALQALQLDGDTMAKIRELKTNEAREAETGLLTHLNDEIAASKAVQRAHDAYLAYLQTALTTDQWMAYQQALINPPKIKKVKP